jgi:hypothetical protein
MTGLGAVMPGCHNSAGHPATEQMVKDAKLREEGLSRIPDHSVLGRPVRSATSVLGRCRRFRRRSADPTGGQVRCRLRRMMGR